MGARNLKGLLGGNEKGKRREGFFPLRQRWVVGTVVAPIFLAAWILTEWSWNCPQCKTSGAGTWALGGIVLLGIPCVVSYFSAREQFSKNAPSWELRHPLFIWIASAMVMGAVSGLLMFAVFSKIFVRLQSSGGALYHELTLGVPLTVLVFLLAATLHMGLVGRTFFVSLPEWWARLAGWVFILTIVWTAGFALAFYAPLGLMWLGRWIKAAGLAWVINTATGVIGGKSSKTGAEDSGSWKETALSVTPYAFIVGLVSLLRRGRTDLCTSKLGDPRCGYWTRGNSFWTGARTLRRW